MLHAVGHAAINAILNKNAEDLKGCALCTTHFPNHEDAKLIMQAQISKIVFLKDDHSMSPSTAIAKKLFEAPDDLAEKVEHVNGYVEENICIIIIIL